MTDSENSIDRKSSTRVFIAKLLWIESNNGDWIVREDLIMIAKKGSCSTNYSLRIVQDEATS